MSQSVMGQELTLTGAAQDMVSSMMYGLNGVSQLTATSTNRQGTGNGQQAADPNGHVAADGDGDDGPPCEKQAGRHFWSLYLPCTAQQSSAQDSEAPQTFGRVIQPISTLFPVADWLLCCNPPLPPPPIWRPMALCRLHPYTPPSHHIKSPYTTFGPSGTDFIIQEHFVLAAIRQPVWLG